MTAPVPANLIKVSISGTMATGATSWSTGFWLKGSGAPQTDDSADTVLAALTASGVITAMRNGLNSADRITTVNTYGYAGGGGASSQGQATVNLAGADDIIASPKSTCCVVTLRTAVITRSGRGRMFIPGNGYEIDPATGLFTTGGIQALVDAWESFRSDPPADTTMEVYSRADGVSRLVTRVDADRIPDRQEHRENGLPTTRLVGT